MKFYNILQIDTKEIVCNYSASFRRKALEGLSPPQLPAATQSPPYPARLTAREVEVLRLLAQGRTDAQIAEHPVSSPRIVNHHTTSLSSKLNVSSRAATRSAHEHYLLSGCCFRLEHPSAAHPPPSVSSLEQAWLPPSGYFYPRCSGDHLTR